LTFNEIFTRLKGYFDRRQNTGTEIPTLEIRPLGGWSPNKKE